MVFSLGVSATIGTLAFIIENGYSLEAIDRMRGESQGFSAKTLNLVYKIPPRAITQGCKLKQMNERLTMQHFCSFEEFAGSFSWDSRTVKKYMNAYVAREIDGLQSFRQYQIAVLGPKVQTFFRLGFSPSMIIKIIPFFESEAMLVSWAREVFGFSGDSRTFFKENTWEEEDFLRIWGVRLTPMLSFSGSNYYLSNI